MRTGMARAQDGTTRLRAAAGTARRLTAAGTARRRAVDMDQTICPACLLPATWPAPSTVPETGIMVSRFPEMTATPPTMPPMRISVVRLPARIASAICWPVRVMDVDSTRLRAPNPGRASDAPSALDRERGGGDREHGKRPVGIDPPEGGHGHRRGDEGGEGHEDDRALDPARDEDQDAEQELVAQSLPLQDEPLPHGSALGQPPPGHAIVMAMNGRFEN